MVARTRRRDQSLIWPGFVDAVTTLLMVLMFVLTIFTVMQSVLRDTITTQDSELESLTAQVAQLADALGLERARASGLETRVAELQAGLSSALAEGERRAGLIASLTADLAARQGELDAAKSRITDFETQVAALLVERDRARGDAERLSASVADLEAAKARLMSEAEAMTLALAKAREEVDANAEAARLAAARRDALEALLAQEKARAETDAAALKAAQERVSEAEAARLADAAALQALREKLANSETELTAMTLALEEERKRAEETLTLLAGARAAAEGATAKDAALAAARTALLAEQEKTLAAAREVELLNRQVAALRSQLGSLQSVLDESKARDEAAKVQLDSLGKDLNAALAQVAAEQRRRAELEAAEAARLAEENRDLSRFRSEFFGQLSSLLQGREGVRVVGDRFVFSSEVLFNPGSADLAPEGQAQIAGVVRILDEVRAKIPPEIDWIIRVDGHTDNVPITGGRFADNWELSQARALSVVRYMQNELGFPPERLAATGFGEYRPVAPGNDEASRALNRRIELKLTER
ncbi:peptidoglycan -binding protein [Tabrizicola thermarum]|uniref:peptidoglycan -binding protein n=1 Tax=Tabrizicola thermarum TaxID=2670345 RepID=UPI000FFBFB96|nr:peptidoglycan -binding protein [Tabrizicola thermarum]